MREKDEEIKRLKMQLESSREVLSSSHTGPSYSNSRMSSNSSYNSSERVAKLDEEITGLKIENRNLELEVKEMKKMIGGKETSLTDSDRLERELTGERDRVRRCERIIKEKEAELLQTLANVGHGQKDSVSVLVNMPICCVITV